MHDTTDPQTSHEVFPPSIYHCVLDVLSLPRTMDIIQLLSRDLTQHEVAVSLLFYIIFLLGPILCSKYWENLLVGKITRWFYSSCSHLFLHLCYMECFIISKYDNVMDTNCRWDNNWAMQQDSKSVASCHFNRKLEIFDTRKTQLK